MSNVNTAKYQCPDCDHIYKESEGCMHEGYAPGTAWTDIPEDFPCPECFVREKADFVLLETESD